MIHPRIARHRLEALLKQFPIVAVLGARQVGKSTLVQSCLQDFTHLDLEDPDDHARLVADPGFVLRENRRLAIDEVQRAPEIFPVVRSFIDAHPHHRVVLLGSAAPNLIRHLSESLTGRVGFLELSGISILEAKQDQLWLRGAFPRVHWSQPRAHPEEWYPSYLRTVLEQDVPQLGFRVPAARMRALLTMLAHSQGSPCNLSELGASLGVSYHAVAHVIDLFEGVYLVRRLQPWHENMKKRLVKAPKVYIRDTGILHSLLGMGFTRRDVLMHPKAGASFESFCIEQILFHARLADPSAEGFHYRIHGGTETDLVLRLRGKLIPIEIKMGLGAPELRSLLTTLADTGASRGYVVNLSTEPVRQRENVTSGPLAWLLRELNLLPGRPRVGQMA